MFPSFVANQVNIFYKTFSTSRLLTDEAFQPLVQMSLFLREVVACIRPIFKLFLLRFERLLQMSSLLSIAGLSKEKVYYIQNSVSHQYHTLYANKHLFSFKIVLVCTRWHLQVTKEAGDGRLGQLICWRFDLVHSPCMRQGDGVH